MSRNIKKKVNYISRSEMTRMIMSVSNPGQATPPLNGLCKNIKFLISFFFVCKCDHFQFTKEPVITIMVFITEVSVKQITRLCTPSILTNLDKVNQFHAVAANSNLE